MSLNLKIKGNNIITAEQQKYDGTAIYICMRSYPGGDSFSPNFDLA